MKEFYGSRTVLHAYGKYPRERKAVWITGVCHRTCQLSCCIPSAFFLTLMDHHLKRVTTQSRGSLPRMRLHLCNTLLRTVIACSVYFFPKKNHFMAGKWCFGFELRKWKGEYIRGPKREKRRYWRGRYLRIFFLSLLSSTMHFLPFLFRGRKRKEKRKVLLMDEGNPELSCSELLICHLKYAVRRLLRQISNTRLKESTFRERKASRSLPYS